jgi:hypothetical protein
VPKKLKLYVWEEVLCDYTCGIAFALAETKEEALELIDKSREWGKPSDELKNIEPKVYATTEKIAYAISGGG